MKNFYGTEKKTPKHTFPVKLVCVWHHNTVAFTLLERRIVFRLTRTLFFLRIKQPILLLFEEFTFLAEIIGLCPNKEVYIEIL